MYSDNTLPADYEVALSNDRINLNYSTTTIDLRNENVWWRYNSSHQILTWSNSTSTFNIRASRFDEVADTVNSCWNGFTYVVRGDLTVRIRGRYHDEYSWLNFIPIVQASTTCEFSSYGATTTADCSDPIFSNPTQDLFNGIILFLLVMVTVLSGAEYLNNRKRQFLD